MEVLAEFGTPEQQRRWLDPLLDGTIRSGFAMTEPGVASSDATNIETRIVRDGDDYLINGQKWFTTGALDPNCAIFIVMGKTDPDAPSHRQQSQILVPRDTPGVDVRRGLGVYGFTDADHGGHGEVHFTDVRVPAGNLIGGRGRRLRHRPGQAGAGPDPPLHAAARHGRAGAGDDVPAGRWSAPRSAVRWPVKGVIADWIAESRVRIEQLRLLVLKAAWLMDTVGNKGAHTEIQAIKIAVPVGVEWILDKADPGPRRPAASARTSRWRVGGPGPVRSDWPTAPTRSIAARWRAANSPSTAPK